MTTYRDLIGTVNITSAGATMSFTNIPQTYDDLELFVSGRGVAAVVSSFSAININGADGSLNSGTSLSYSGAVRQTANSFTGDISGSSAAANSFGTLNVYIPGYKTSIFKSLVSRSTGGHTSTYGHNFLAGLWRSTNAITRLDIIANGGFVVNSVGYLYGIKRS